MPLDDETMQILAKTAQVAGRTGQKKEAVAILDALAAISPDDESIKLIRASTFLHLGLVDDATKVLDAIVARNAGNTRAKTLLGMAHHFSGKRAERDRLFQEVIDANSDSEAMVIAKDLIHS